MQRRRCIYLFRPIRLVPIQLGPIRLFAHAALLASFALFAAGCEGLGSKSKVKAGFVPPPPERVSSVTPRSRQGLSDASDPAAAERGRSRLTQADEPGSQWKPASGRQQLASWQSTTEAEGAGEPVQRGEVAAIVNGVPIFVDDVLLPFARGLAEAKKQLPPAEFLRQRNELIAKQLQPHIEQQLLVHALKSQLKEEQLTQMLKQMDKQFEEELQSATMKELGVATIGELEIKLRKNGSSVENLRTNFRNRRMAQHYLSTRVNTKTTVDRPDLVRYYQEHLEDYAQPGRVKWQQIRLSFEKNGGSEQAYERARQIVDLLDQGQDFAAMARKYSDGPKASTGGFWDWTTQGSLAFAEIDKALFELPVGAISDPLEGTDSTSVVRVIERQEPGHRPFADVQSEIREKLRETSFRRAVKELIDDLQSNASIEKLIGQ